MKAELSSGRSWGDFPLPKRLLHVCPLSPTDSSHLAGAGRTFLPFPASISRDVRQLPALTFLAGGSWQLEQQPQEQQAAGRHAGSTGCALGTRSSERLVNYQTPSSRGRSSHLVIQILLGKEVLLCLLHLGRGDLNLTVPLGRAWKGTQAQNICIGPGGKNKTQVGETLPQ